MPSNNVVTPDEDQTVAIHDGRETKPDIQAQMSSPVLRKGNLAMSSPVLGKSNLRLKQENPSFFATPESETPGTSGSQNPDIAALNPGDITFN